MSLIVSLENYKMPINDKSDLGGSDMSGGPQTAEYKNVHSIIADSPFSCKEFAVSKNRLIKFIPSEEAMWLLKNRAHAFCLLAIIAESVKRNEGDPYGLEIGEAFIGPCTKYGMTEKNYRNAKKILERIGQIKIVETNRTRKKSKYMPTAVSTKVKLLSSSIWDIGLNVDDDRPATDQRLTDGKQEYKESEEEKESKKAFINESISTKGDAADLEPAKKVLKKRKPKTEKIERQPFVQTTEIQHKALLDQHGDLLVSMFYKKLSEWKIGRGVGDRPNDYLAITRWVIQAVKNDIEGPSKLPKTNWERNQQFIREVMDAFPGKTQGMYFFYKSKLLCHKGHNFDLSGEMPHEDFSRLVCQHLKISMEIVDE